MNNRVLKRGIWAVAVFLGVLSVCLLMVRQQLISKENKSNALAAEKAIVQVDDLLGESDRATMLGSDFLLSPCTPQTETELNRLVIVFQHVRLITLVGPAGQLCSSYHGTDYDDISDKKGIVHRLMIKEGNHISPDHPVIILANNYLHGKVAASLSADFITDILNILNASGPLSLSVNGLILSADSRVSKVSESGGHEERVQYSAHYPFGVIYRRVTALSFDRFLSDGYLAALFSLLLALLAAVQAFRFLLRPPTPAEELQAAIVAGQIVPYYQPVVFARGGELAGVEILARWERGSVPCSLPDSFIPLAESSGLIIPLTRRLMDRVVTDLVPVITSLPSPFHIGINISAAHATDHDFLQSCQQFLTQFPEGGVDLILEITEREPFEMTPSFQNALAQLQAAGVKIALDDFGTGYSNLGYLTQLSFDFIKIDKSFVGQIDHHPDSTLLVESVIGMARKLKLSIIAEGVETVQQSKYLADSGVIYLQGYYFSRPLPYPKFAHRYLSWNNLQVTPENGPE